ncbi:efflux RND transporter periplasmic adaptor subunit [Solimonas terrae]|uniref:Efflux RND transporter periplasmic adaptor subunit n=1 Tax=Solimonas terrae TaxID=1396819 RepID=A0A6M2BSR8_9GAMM|nr:efflux RND transporter periplasmic adaptor subunit [Solimonas terrae]NGY05682.1 efflux RND transporter periplasmic adaptor subunit [Solimonas terrae]
MPIIDFPLARRGRLASLAGALSVALLLGACGKKADAPPPAPTQVTVVTLKPQAVPLTTVLSGRTSAYRTAEVRPQVDGVIRKRTFTEGGMVKAGEPLYLIDPAPYQAQYDSARAALARAEATAKSAESAATRSQALLDARAVSEQSNEDAVAARDAAKADVASAKAAVETARIKLVYTRVLAPISGRIGRSGVTEGALVSAGQSTALATIQQLDPIYVDVPQPSTMLLRLQREFASGQLKKAGDRQAEVHLQLEDGSDYASAGTLQFSEVTVDPSTGSVTLRSIFPNGDGLLLPGMFVKETIQEGVSPDALLVPQQGVTRDPTGKATALVVGDGNKVELRTLTTARTVGDQWLVTDGVQAGDKVIVEGLQKVKPGAEVRPVERGSEDAAGPDAAPAGKP